MPPPSPADGRHAAGPGRPADPGAVHDHGPHPGDAHHHRPDALRGAGAAPRPRVKAQPSMTQPANADLADRIEQLARVRVLCVGDVMLDRYIYGTVERISPEAPIPVLRIQRESDMLGGAGNVLRNLLALGAEVCFLSVVGDDPAGRRSRRSSPPRSGSSRTSCRSGRGRRRSRPATSPASSSCCAPTARRWRRSPRRCARIWCIWPGRPRGNSRSSSSPTTTRACSAPGRGGRRDRRRARAPARSSWSIPRATDYARYRGANVLTPNRRELAEATDMPVGTAEEIVAAARRLIGRLDLDAVLVTRSQDGMTLVERDGAIHHLPAEAREVYRRVGRRRYGAGGASPRRSAPADSYRERGAPGQRRRRPGGGQDRHRRRPAGRD
jgi:hypothetical protein